MLVGGIHNDAIEYKTESARNSKVCFVIRMVVSRKKVCLGGSLLKSTLSMDVFPALHDGQFCFGKANGFSARLRRPNNKIFVLITPFSASLWTLGSGSLPLENAGPILLPAEGMIVGRLFELDFWPIRSSSNRYGGSEQRRSPSASGIACHKWSPTF